MSCAVAMYGSPSQSLGESPNLNYYSRNENQQDQEEFKLFQDCRFTPRQQQLQQPSLRTGGIVGGSQPQGSWSRQLPTNYSHFQPGSGSPQSFPSNPDYGTLHSPGSPTSLSTAAGPSNSPTSFVVSSGCMCPSCSYNNRVPQFHHPPPLVGGPPHLAQQPPAWQHSEHIYPPGHPAGHFPGHSSFHPTSHHDSYSGPPPPQLPMSASYMHERNSNEASVVSPILHSTSAHDVGRDVVPQDPREWSSSDVVRWIHWAAQQYKLRNAHPERFQMNGKALCLMDLSMFVYRVPDGGEKLYQDFQCRLQKALYQDKLR